ncbi:trimeric intracellular cation channel family protein [Thalassovita mangrovi]|uniref:Trimeric intracellular cation channel family protein n=1 Tax=Thalassovita mangrovi TaxID=2692236 RepID=A0A6L8LLJ6_9RHOB|nr:trimeric intracellular cation channel family protein [Thalassovita mangrovi]MYM56765.1 trimeric intracellular cation channel family protein [Thalassovita mangrovi]
MTNLILLDYASVLVFALTGALAASRAQLDLVGFMFIANLTALGGGTLRDVLLDRTPLWVAQPGFVAVASLAAAVVFFTAHLLESRYRALLWFDSLALAVAVPAGAGVAISLGHPWPVTLIMGTLTGTFGGMMRDVVCNEVPLVLKKGELYVTAAFAGSAATVLAATTAADPLIVAAAGGLVTWALRAGSLVFGWSLPSYKSRPPRV